MSRAKGSDGSRQIGYGQPVEARQLDRLVEIAIVERPVPTNRELASAHHAFERVGLNAPMSLFMYFVMLLVCRRRYRSGRRRVGYHEQIVEDDAEILREPFACTRSSAPIGGSTAPLG